MNISSFEERDALSVPSMMEEVVLHNKKNNYDQRKGIFSLNLFFTISTFF